VLAARSAAFAAPPVAAPRGAEPVLEIPPAKRQAARLETTEVAWREFRVTRAAPGRLQYDQRRHIEIAPATAGFVGSIAVAPGDRAASGTALATISSPEVGGARADLLELQAAYDIAERSRQRAVAMQHAVQQLTEGIRREASLEELQNTGRSAALGSPGKALVAAYADYLIARQLQRYVAPVADQGVLSGRLLAERQIAEARAKTSLHATIDEALFGAETERLASEYAAENARRRLLVGRERVTSLLGYEDASDPSIPGSLSQFVVKAPFAGVVEALHRSPNERIAAGEALLTFADTSQLWAVADVREPEWAALGLAAGHELELTIPAEPTEPPRKAYVHYVGREVSPETNAVPLIAIVDNREGRLRPGQYVRVKLPLGAPVRALAAPESAIVAIEGKHYAFVQTAEGRYRRTPIVAGATEDGWTAILEGLAEGARVVSHGGFALKSEQLLETVAE
jgi:cobalt-zinc-cadmium efflux system membrane fusion protein